MCVCVMLVDACKAIDIDDNQYHITINTTWSPCTVPVTPLVWHVTARKGRMKLGRTRDVGQGRKEVNMKGTWPEEGGKRKTGYRQNRKQEEEGQHSTR